MSTVRQTRSKKGKAATGANSGAANASSPSPGDEDAEHNPFADFEIPEDIDVDLLSNLFPDHDIASPTPEFLLSLYKVLQDQTVNYDAVQGDLDEARADIERKDVELDQALQDKERSAAEKDTLLESVQRELTQVKKERDELAATKSSLATQLSTVQASQSSSSSELGTLKQRVDDVEREKRDLVNIISRLKEESTQREEEISTLRSNLKEARHEHQALESQVRELRSTEAATKFKVDTLSQQLQLSQTEAQRANEDLEAKVDEFSKYRRAKQAELSELQSSHDSLSQRHDSAQSTLKSLQSAHTAQSHQLTQALEKVQDLTGKIAERDATYASEAAGLRRVIALMEEREQKAKEIVENVENEWATVGEKAQIREDKLREEMERERKARDQAEARVEQLETVLDRMGRGELPTPGRGIVDLSMDGMIGLSPTVAMASRAQKGGKTFTEVYADYVKLQDDYARKSAEYEHMDRTLSVVLAQIEERAPILAEQRIEYERLQIEASQLSAQLSQAISDRDIQGHYAKDNADKLAATVKENQILTKNLDDLGAQISGLLKEIARRDDPTIPSDEDLEALPPVEPAENIDAVITNNLVLFRNVENLQEQNKKLLKIVRELGDKMEAEEKEYRDAMEREQAEAVREAHEAMTELATQLERQKQSSESTIKAYVAERDTLKVRLARAERGMGASMSGGMDGVTVNGIPGGSSDGLARQLADVQNQFDTYKEEMGIDTVRLREELVDAQRGAGQLSAALAKANAKIDYWTDRHRMSQEQFELKKGEIANLTHRNEQLFIQYTRAEIECQRALDELQVASGKIEQLRNENANLRAEKKIWEAVQGRLMEENRTLTMERSHLSDLMGNVQKMHNDLELSGQNERRRLESQLQMLENQTHDLRNQLSQERDSVRHATLQKDIELKDIQSQLKKITQEFSQTRELLVGAETSKKHLEERVNDLTKQLQGNEEKLSVYERRPSVASGSNAASTGAASANEQQLQSEVAELRSALKVCEVDLATARRNVEQFKQISEANEAALASLHATHDDYKTVTEAQITMNDSEIQALQEKLTAAQEEINALKNTYNELQRKFETERTEWLSDKKVLEDTIADMSASEKTSESDRNVRDNEVRMQEERTTAAEERYSREVVAHAESIKIIENLKQQLAASQARTRELQTQAETAIANLSSSESSWKTQKDTLEKEANDLRARCQDLTSQNDILHQHLEAVSTQAARIRQVADSNVTGETTGATDGDADTHMDELRSVVKYLRKEKEIVDLQLDLSKQENARFKTQIEHLSQALEESRKSLSEERERAMESAASDAQHQELLDRINQLNILRESNTTLRAASEAQTKRARELDVKLREVTAQLEPIKEQARVAQAEVQAKNEQIVRLENENKRWQERNTQLLSKYDRIDPAEMQALKSQIEQLQAQNAELQAANDTTKQQLAEQITKAENADASFKARFEKNMAEAKRRIGVGNEAVRNHKAQIEELEGKVRELTTERDGLLAVKATLEAEAAAAAATTVASTESSATIAALQAERDKLAEERDKLVQERVKLMEENAKLLENRPVPEPSADGSSDDAKAQWEAEKAALIKARDDAIAEAQKAAEEVKSALEEQRGLRTSNGKLQQRIQEIIKARAADNERAAATKTEAVAAAVEQAKSEQTASTSTAPSEELLKKHAEELKSLEERLTAKHQEELKATQSKADSSSNEAAIAAAVEAKVKELEATRADEIAKAIESGRHEQATKLKLKDSQLIRAQNRLKELELLKHEWEKEKAPTPTTSTDPKSPVVITPSTSGQAVDASTSAAPTKGSGTASLPARPGAATRGARGGARGGAVRGRGGMPAAAAAAAANSASGGVTILGAAGKRPRDSDNTGGDDSLAKRLKPAEGTKPPVAIRRPPAS